MYGCIIFVIFGFLYAIIAKDFVFFNYLFPPTNFYKPLAESPVRFDEKGSLLKCSFANKYPGKHALLAYTESPIQMEDSFSETINATITVKQNENLIYEKNISNSRSWIKNSDGKTAFYLFNYSVPEDLPKNQKLFIEVVLLEKNYNIGKKYGKTIAVLKKISDQ